MRFLIENNEENILSNPTNPLLQQIKSNLQSLGFTNFTFTTNMVNCSMSNKSVGKAAWLVVNIYKDYVQIINLDTRPTRTGLGTKILQALLYPLKDKTKVVEIPCDESSGFWDHVKTKPEFKDFTFKITKPSIDLGDDSLESVLKDLNKN